MLILEIAAGVVLGVLLLAALVGFAIQVARKKERDKRIASEWAARAKFEYHKFWTDELHKLSSPDEIFSAADKLRESGAFENGADPNLGRSAIPDYSRAILEWAGRLTTEDKKFWQYVNEKFANPATRAYYTHPGIRTADEKAQVAAHPSPVLDADALGARFAVEARAAANLSIVAGASQQGI